MELSDRIKSNMEVVLEEACCELPNGGDHESRRLIAEQLLEAAESGHTDFERATERGAKSVCEGCAHQSPIG
ncbi:hypothetical protein ABIF63_003449 [Bradyrhizobium japonicum]|uniref:Uncharacterized protein n=1 Tax=Bradyrhizobium japonicum TaxID=375 RepID=A0ABV2RQX9_BRAJP